jgi:hypothetical protein
LILDLNNYMTLKDISNNFNNKSNTTPLLFDNTVVLLLIFIITMTDYNNF